MIFTQLMNAFKVMHEQGIVHRHITLENILVSFPQYQGDPTNEYSLKSFKNQADLQKISFKVLVADFGSACLKKVGMMSSYVGEHTTMAP